MTDLFRLGVAELSSLLATRQVSALEVLEAHMERIAQTEPRIQAFLSPTAELARSQAKVVDEQLARGLAVHPLAGVPMGVKDVLCQADVATTAGSRILAGFKPPYSATVIERLEAVGAVSLGKTNCDEFAMGSSTENSAFHPTRNPWDLGRVPGGSSGGTAAAVAAGQVVWGLGTDTGGSIRQPAALCGVVGMKPTYGRVSRYGLIAFASSLDQIGPIARSVDDCAQILEVISGEDHRDATCAARPPLKVVAELDRPVDRLRIGVPSEYFDAGSMELGVHSAIDAALKTLAGSGAEVVELGLPHSSYGLSAYYIIAPAEASSNLARFDGVRFGLRLPGDGSLESAYSNTRRRGFGDEVRRRIMLGTYVLSAGYYDAYYSKAQRIRTLIKRDFDAAFKACDVIVGPTSPTVAFRFGERTDTPLAMYSSDVFTLGASLAGLPALSLPCGLSQAMPVGLQVIGPAFADDLVLRVGRTYERASGLTASVVDPR